MAAWQQMELDIGCVMAQAGFEAVDYAHRKELVQIARDVQQRRRGTIFIFFPILGDSAAHANDAGGLAGMRSDEAIVESDGLREAHKERSRDGDRKPFAKNRQGGEYHRMMVLDVIGSVASGAPVVADVGQRRWSGGQVVLIGSAERGDDVLGADGRHGEAEHDFGVRTVAVKRENEQRGIVNVVRRVEQAGSFEAGFETEFGNRIGSGLGQAIE